MSRCEVCGWPLAVSREKGCMAGDCSYRPDQGSAEWYRIKARRDAMEAPASCPQCIDETDCSHVEVCAAVESVYR